ncbi:unnamed protein product [Medioppia subpectinata]|uniref:Globin domain-containing protein n=1 Tax=Medioppia subpectinata TaxID=1979941 RepID=A0A7R9L537_9ACAR|nr:unnamed protein product [Medioppia subpectinata]CAG2115503.1 unnamed protein product [Medioppia subpectinata]
MNLNANELATLRTVWDAYSADSISNGCDLFIRLFKENPTYIQWFPKIGPNLKNDPEVIRISQTDIRWVSRFIDAAIAGDNQGISRYLRKLAGCHVRAKVNEVMYDVFKECILSELVEKLGPSVMTVDTELRGNDAVIRNGISDLEFVSKIIDSLVEQSPEETRKLIRKQAGCHNSHKVTEGMFDRMRLCVLGELNDKLGPNVMTDATQAAWHKFFKVYIAALYPA